MSRSYISMLYFHFQFRSLSVVPDADTSTLCWCCAGAHVLHVDTIYSHANSLSQVFIHWNINYTIRSQEAFMTRIVELSRLSDKNCYRKVATSVRLVGNLIVNVLGCIEESWCVPFSIIYPHWDAAGSLNPSSGHHGRQGSCILHWRNPDCRCQRFISHGTDLIISEYSGRSPRRISGWPTVFLQGWF